MMKNGIFKSQDVDCCTLEEAIFNTSDGIILPFKLKKDYQPKFRITAMIDLLSDYFSKNIGYLLKEHSDNLISEYHNIKENSIIARNLQLKYLLNKDRNEILKIIKNIETNNYIKEPSFTSFFSPLTAKNSKFILVARSEVLRTTLKVEVISNRKSSPSHYIPLHYSQVYYGL